MFLLELLEKLLSCVVYFHSRIKYMLVNTKYYLLVLSEHLFLDVKTMWLLSGISLSVSV
jgi:hypothetical protein